MADMKRTLSTFLLCISIAVSILLVYGGSATFDFVSFDDPVYVRENPHVAGGLSGRGIVWAMTSVHASNWHPLTWISHMADMELFGMDPGRHHLVNVLFHLAASVLLFLVLDRMTGALYPSAFTAALFALHPLHVESVAWISERKDVLSAFFWMLTLLCYSRYVKRPSLGRYALVCASFTLGLMAKPMLVTLPVVLLLLDFWPLKRMGMSSPRPDRAPRPQGPGDSLIRLGPLLLEKVPLVILAAAAGATALYSQWASGALKPLTSVGPGMRMENALISSVVYLAKTVWPADLCIFYPYPRHIGLPLVILCALAVIVISIAAVMAARRFPYVTTGWFWYVITLAPVIGIVQVGSQSMADRYTYIPLVGVFMMLSWGLGDLYRWTSPGRAVRMLLGASAVGLLVILAVVSFRQVLTWQNSETLFSHALSVNPDNYLACDSLGVALHHKGDVPGAIRYYQESIRLSPHHANARCNLGVALAGMGRYREAIDQYERCLRIRPGFPAAHYNLGVACAVLGEKEKAIHHYLESIRGDPGNVDARNNLGLLLADTGNLEGAIENYLKALEMEPGNERVRTNLAAAMKRRWPGKPPAQ